MSTYTRSKHTSLWMDTTPSTSYPSLDHDVAVEVAVIGGGIAGLTTACLLAQRGKKVALLEAGRIISAVTGYTTAKLTTNHGLMYRQLIERYGLDDARMYAEANEAGFQHILSYCSQKHINCDLREMPAYTYGVTEEDRTNLKLEADAAASLGLPAEFVEQIDLPLAVSGAMRFQAQYVFHPRKYLLSVAEDFVQMGGQIFENSRATELTDGPTGCTLTANGATVVAQDVVVATNYPTYDPNFFFARLGHLMSYVIGVSLSEPLPRGMYYATDRSGHSIRPHWLQDGREVLLIGGGEHPVGKGGDTREHYEQLEKWARANFDVTSIDYHWCTHDAEPYDNVPMVGKATSSTDRIYVATGFRGWGMTNATAAAMILADEILLQESRWGKVFNPSRAESFFSAETIKSNVTVIGEFVKGRFFDRPEGAERLQPGEGGVYELEGKKLAVCRDDNGELRKLSASCTHMGCFVEWNQAEQTWDCPCHGSRFSKEGRVIHAPALRDLQPPE